MNIAIIGCGTMGEAFARFWAAKKYKLMLFDAKEKKAQDLAQEIHGTFCADITKAAKQADWILLAIRPQDMEDVAMNLMPVLEKKHTVVSIMAGVTVKELKKRFKKAHIVRMTPNIALLVHKAVLGFVQDDVSQSLKERITELFEGLGFIAWVPENKMDALMAISASGSAFWLLFLESLIEASLIMGFHPPESQAFLLQTMEGVASLLKEKKMHPSALKWMITTPQGMTIEGLKVMEDHGIRSAIINGLLASYHKAIEMNRSHAQELPPSGKQIT